MSDAQKPFDGGGPRRREIAELSDHPAQTSGLLFCPEPFGAEAAGSNRDPPADRIVTSDQSGFGRTRRKSPSPQIFRPAAKISRKGIDKSFFLCYNIFRL